MKLFKRKSILSIILTFILILSLSTFSFTASAAWVESEKQRAIVYGTMYTYNSEIDRYDTSMQYGTAVSADEVVPAGYIGTLQRLYTSSGAIVASSAWDYNASSCKGFASYSHYTAANYPSARYFYSYGRVQFYDGNGYSTYTCTRTPNMASPYYTETRSIINMEENIDTSIRTNQNGEIHGSELFLNQIGIEPDLISAIGTNNVSGYVRASDLEPDITSPEEALEYQKALETFKTIPLYAEDGVTVIGSFVIDNSCTSVIETLE